MDQDLAGLFRRCTCGAPLEPVVPARPGEPIEWGGTGLCPEAQADGVPCPTPSETCDRCGRARQEFAAATGPLPRIV